MLQSINTTYFPDGYSLNEVPCNTLTIAHSLGVLDKSLYYQYCTIEALDRLMGNANNNYKILEYLGIIEKSAFDENCTSLIEFLNLCITIGVPLLLHTNYNCIYYSDGYKKEDTNNHTIMLTGYDKDTNIVQIQDYEIVYWYDSNFTKGQIYYLSRVPYKLIEEIILNTQLYFNEDSINFLKNNCVYLCKSKTYTADKQNILDLITKNKDRMLDYLRDCIVNYKPSCSVNIEKDFHYIRIRFLGAYKVILSYIEIYILDSNEVKEKIDKFIHLLDVLLCIWQRDAMKNNKIELDKMFNIINELQIKFLEICRYFY